MTRSDQWLRQLCACFCGLLLSGCHGNIRDSWDTVRDWSVRPVCVPMPRNLTLCHGIGYSQLRLPNLLHHGSISEIVQQAASWTPVLQLGCDPDAQLLLCSLYAPTCVQRRIYPCRSLCHKVERNCGGVIQRRGIPWADDVNCDQFPADDELCIKPQDGRRQPDGAARQCPVCRQPDSRENLLRHFCSADVVLTTRVRRITPQRVQCGRARVFKPRHAPPAQRRSLRRPSLTWRPDPDCCPGVQPRAGKLLIMARWSGPGLLVPSLVTPWRRRRLFRSLRSILKQKACDDPGAVNKQVLPPMQTTRRWQQNRDIGGGSRRHQQQHRLRTSPGTVIPGRDPPANSGRHETREQT